MQLHQIDMRKPIAPRTWLMPGFWPSRIVSFLVGATSSGKSTLCCKIVAHVTRGIPWPDKSACPEGAVLFLTNGEDEIETWRARLEAAGADLKRVYFAAVGDARDRRGTLRPLARAVKKIGKVKLIFIDPYVGLNPIQGEAATRSRMEELSEFTQDHDLLIISILHMTKKGEQQSGSQTLMNVCRFAVRIDNDNPRYRVLRPIKSNYGPIDQGIAFRLERSNNVPRVVILSKRMVVTDEDNRLTDAKHFLAEEFEEAGGMIPVEVLRKEATAAGHSWTTIVRAKHAVGIYRSRRMSDCWVWELVDQSDALA